MRRGLRFCSRGSLWQLRNFLLSAPIKDSCSPDKQFFHLWSPRQSQTWLSRRPVSSVRFYSQGANHGDDLEDGERLPSQPADTASAERQRKSPFLELLESCGSPSDVLDLTGKYSPTARQVSHCLNHMWATTKKMTDEQRRYELQLMFEHPAFDQLLQRAMKIVVHIHDEDVTYSLLSMVNLGVPQRSRVVQTFLRTCQVDGPRPRAQIILHLGDVFVFFLCTQMCLLVHQQEKLNDFDEKSLSILASSLEQMEDGANVRALKEGMRYEIMGRKNSLASKMPCIIKSRVTLIFIFLCVLGWWWRPVFQA